MARIPSWLEIFVFLVENNPQTFTDVMRGSKVSWSSVSKNMQVLDELGVININTVGKKKLIIKTQKFYDNQQMLMDLYKVLDGD